MSNWKFKRDLLVARFQNVRDPQDNGLVVRVFAEGEANMDRPFSEEYRAKDPVALSRVHAGALPWDEDRVIAYKGPAIIERGKYLIIPATAEDIVEYVRESSSD